MTMPSRQPVLHTLTGKVTVVGIVAFAVILIAASAVLAAMRSLDTIVDHVADETVSEVIQSEAFAIDITRATAELQSFMREGDPDELAEAEEALERAGQALAVIESVHGQHAVSEETRDLGALNEPRGVIFGELTQIADALEAGAVSDEQVAAYFEQLEEVEDQLSALRAEGEVVLARDREAIAANVAQSLGQAGASVMVLIVFAIGLLAMVIVLLRRQIIAPIGELAQAALLVTEARLDQRVSETGWDEIGRLQRSFNTMTGTLQARDAALAEQVVRAERARAEAEHARAELQQQLATVAEQRELIGNLSLPILPVDGDTLVMPLIGALDERRMAQALTAVERSGARYVLLDVTGVPVLDTGVAEGIRTLMQAVRLLGAELVLVGIRPEVAQTMVSYSIDITQVQTRASLAEGLASVRARRTARSRPAR
jgi:rsbT co-antagonist protein RsbR